MIYIIASTYESALSAIVLPTYSIELAIFVIAVAVFALLFYLRTYLRQMKTKANK